LAAVSLFPFEYIALLQMPVFIAFFSVMQCFPAAVPRCCFFYFWGRQGSVSLSMYILFMWALIGYTALKMHIEITKTLPIVN